MKPSEPGRYMLRSVEQDGEGNGKEQGGAKKEWNKSVSCTDPVESISDPASQKAYWEETWRLS